MRICYFGHYDAKYIRNRMIIDGLRARGFDVIHCNQPFIYRTPKKYRNKIETAVYLFFYDLKLLWLYLKLFFRLLLILCCKKIDVIIVGHPYHAEVIPAFVLSRIFRKLLVFDTFVPNYEAGVIDRKLINADSYNGRLLKRLDSLSYKLADVLLTDTNAHKKYFFEYFNINPKKLFVVYVGEDNRIFLRREKQDSDYFSVVFCGSYVPLHGIEFIVKAGKLLEKFENIKITIIGSGQTYDDIIKLSRELETKNICFVDSVDNNKLVDYYADADVGLGIFGTTRKADMVVPVKIFSLMAMAKPIVTMESEAIKEVLVDGYSALFTPPGNPEAIAEKIEELYHDKNKRNYLGNNAFNVYNENYTLKHIGQCVEGCFKGKKSV
ncbi:glycosyltransferase family 4 protein [bacterium]|nr:glycosyltransferase family 4 protein [bacterium]